MKKELIGLSKFISLVLRHKPDSIGLKLDDNGWADVHELITCLSIYQKNKSFTKELLNEIVQTNDKKRFEYNQDGCKIRARQGHSVDVDLNYSPSIPPFNLFHGTAHKYIDLIKKNGIKKMKRHHVHLSKDYDTAVKVGKRHGEVIVLKVDSKSMSDDGFTFFKTDNDVWLTDEVPIKYIEL